MEIGCGSSESSTVEQVPRQNQDHDSMVGIDYDYDYEGCDESSELELGLGLSLGVMGSCRNNNIMNKNAQIPRILTAKDLAVSSACSSLGLKNNNNNNNNNNSGVSNVENNKSGIVSAGSKRAASPTRVSQVVGWPPIRSYRMSSMANQAKSIATGERNSQFAETKGKDGVYGAQDKVNSNSKDKVQHKSSLFVKVNMDGVAIGRKVDLTAHSSYESLALTLEEMFDKSAEKSKTEELIWMPKVTRQSKFLDGTSDLVLTYEDKDGDWMLVGDVPWRMFVTYVKRLKIMKTSEANGLAPRLEDRSSKQKSRPI